MGRDDERRRLGLLLGNARNGRGGSLLITGEPGIGKTALLEAAAAGGTGLSMIRLDGFESEMTLPFAGIQRLTIPLSEHLAAISERQRQAIEVASGVAEGPPPDRFLVGLGVLGLLAAAAVETPVVCAVDDAHLLDQESLDVMAFVARRLAVEPVAMLFASRDEGGVATRMGGVSELALGGLDQESATALLSRSLAAPVDPASAAAIARATGGNPLALIDLAEGLSAQELGGLGLGTDPIPVGPRLEAHYVRRVRQTDTEVQQWVLLAAADTTGNVDFITSAARTMGLGEDVVDRAETAGLVELRETLRFRHPLVRSAVYNAASGADRRRAHRALAGAADHLGMVELEAWHSAKATLGTDAQVADRLEYAADLAARRGGFASRASILTRAAELTPPGRVKDSRLVGAAEAALVVGAAQIAHELLERVDVDSADRVDRGRAIVVRCALGLFTADPAVLSLAAAELVRAADEFHGRDTEREQRALLKAFESCAVTDRLMQGVSQHALGSRFEAASKSGGGPDATILAGLGSLILQPYAEAVPLVRAAFDAIVELPDHEMMHMGSAIAALGAFLWDDAGRSAALARAAAAARDAGALQALDTLMWVASLSELSGGTVKLAEEAIEQVREVRLAMGYDAENVINAALMAWTGAPRHVVLAIADGANSVGFGGVGATAVAAVALRDLAEGGYRDAYDRLKPLIQDPFLQVTPLQYPDFVEAAVRSGHAHEARPYVGLLMERAMANDSLWCRGVAERSRALTSEDSAAEDHFVAAVQALERTGAEIDLARAHLLYGEWLRRTRRRREAGEQLQLAVQHFEHSGAQMFVPRAQAELEAVGAKPVVHSGSGAPDFTTQELTIARLAAVGHTNPEIAANLFISVNTVDYHLRKVFQKLGISSRRQLAERLDAADR
ncbi:putative transcriptional regulator, LuxR family protein [Planotetraspora thailandica]|uniref:Putative transcriptional regulator, LuxR family protein n=1 Tax=Planotetraspora thailandica TaxID=487172 RepID=A0A8J3V6P0_9ACTN|nr:putative transcriptional regulator, LuxR family protein [Planotetraspora thailandica]